MSAEGLAAIVRTAHFPIWRAASIETAPRLRLVTINGRVRSVLLEFSGQLLVQSRFRTRADEEPNAFAQFASDALDYWANVIPEGEQTPTVPTRVKIAALSWQLEPIGYRVVGGSTTLEIVGHPSAAVDVALVTPRSDPELVEFAGQRLVL
jgi:hypothetical protein